jgi:peptide/nickel transport system substrate-binding protein
MAFLKRAGLVWIGVVLLAVGCAPQAPGTGQGRAGEAGAPVPSAPKRITAAMMGNPPLIYERIIGGGSGGRVPGLDALETLVNMGLTIKDDKGVLAAIIAEAVPSLDNGMWRIFPDGRTETTWKIKPGVAWHDGTPFTSADLLFLTRVEQDPALPVERQAAYAVIDGIDAPDTQTVTVRWKSPYIEADDFFSRSALARHILEPIYVQDKDAFMGAAYWGPEFVGNGAYKVREWVRDSHVILAANDQYVMGRPKIDTIDVRFIADENAFMAAILAGTVDVTLGKSITLEQTLQLRDQWRDGQILYVPETAMKIWPQLLNPNPAVILDVRFRKASFYAINRQEMVDTIMGGLSSVAHSVLLPNEPELAEVQDAIVRYDYDPRRAAQMIEELGYTKAADGFYRDPAGQQLRVELSATAEDQNTKPMFATADSWQRVGIAVDPVSIPIQRQRDREYRATFPGFTLQGGSSGVAAIKNSHGSQARLPENNYTGSNYSRYMNPEFDALIDRFLTTIPHTERMNALRQVVRHMTDTLSMMNLYYATTSTMVKNNVLNVPVRIPWNVQEWDVK